MRADPELRFNPTNPQSPILAPRRNEASRRTPHAAGRGLAVFPRSTNGLTEYRAGLDHSPRDGSLVAAGHDQAIYAIELDPTGSRVIEKSQIARELQFVPLDVTARSRDQTFPGTIWITDHSDGRIWVLDPQRLRPRTPLQLARDVNEWLRMRLAERARYY